MISVDEGRYRVRLKSYKIAKDRLVIITGGEEEHIGSATLIETKDHIVSEKMANIIYDTIEKNLLVICGIDILVRNAKECVEHLY